MVSEGAKQLLSDRRDGRLILPSMLRCDFGNLEAEIRALEAAGAPGLHLDVMDGHFVPNLTYGPSIVAAMNAVTDLPLDVHLMVSNPGETIEQYAEAGADVLTIHAEAVPDPSGLLERIRGLGAAAGLAFNPSTPLEAVEPFVEQCDLVLVMSVEPGFGGQAFETSALDKISTLRQRLPENTLLEVDGGVNEATIADCCQAGVDLLVVGSAILTTDDYGAAMSRLSEIAASAVSETH